MDPRSVWLTANDTTIGLPDDELETNADGSLDLYFVPATPKCVETSWIETVPGRGFYVMFRCYTPTAPLFDGTWTVPDVERI